MSNPSTPPVPPVPPVPSARSSSPLDERSRPPRRRDEGQAALLVVAVAAVLLVALMAALSAMGRTTLDRTRAQTAADAAALASLDGGRPAAVSLADRHGASLVAWTRGPGLFEVSVTVRLGDTTASARASNAP